MNLRPVFAFLSFLLCLSILAHADAPPASLFDPAKDIRVADVKPGMLGYGLSVFSGTKIEKFDVEVIDVVKNFNPKYDAILVRCKGDFLTHTGAIEGMSGSPIYLIDASGNPKLAGAFAYGWPLSKDPIGGVQPIEYMLSLPGALQTPQAPRADASDTHHQLWTLPDLRRQRTNSNLNSSSASQTQTMLGSAAVHLEPLKSPLMIGGFSAAAMEKITPLFAGTGLVPMQAGSGSSGDSKSPAPKLEPGSVLAVPLLTGDADMTAIGTCTEVVGDRIFGFGHPFNGEGPIALPMGSGSIAMVVANLQSSFKLGFLSTPSGTLTTDQTVGVAGQIGAKAPMVPIEVQVIYDDKSINTTYHFQSALHPKLTPLIAGAAVQAAITGDKGLPQFHTLDYDLTMDFANGQSIHDVNTSVNVGVSDIMDDLTLPVTEAIQNPFKEVTLTGLKAVVHVSSTARAADILSVMVPRSKYEPGETVKAFVAYQPFRDSEATMPLELQLPHDLPDGTYQLTVSDWNHFVDDERTDSAYKFTADNADEIFAVLKYMISIRHNALYLRLFRQPDGVAVGRTALQRLPSSQRQVLMDSGRSDVQPIVSSTLKIVPTDMVMNGSAQFEITIERKNKVEVAPAAPANAGPAAPAVPASVQKKSDNSPAPPVKH